MNAKQKLEYLEARIAVLEENYERVAKYYERDEERRTPRVRPARPRDVTEGTYHDWYAAYERNLREQMEMPSSIYTQPTAGRTTGTFTSTGLQMSDMAPNRVPE